jgi:alanyl-tRNA synthetase
MNLTYSFHEYCDSLGIENHFVNNILSYDDTTLFCPAGMQQFKAEFKNPGHSETVANIQKCLRMNDLESLGDATHLALFHMLGLFSFRDWDMDRAVEFWMTWLKNIDLPITSFHIHPDKFNDWKHIAHRYDVTPVADIECKWSDGDIGGYCLEMYYKGIEIGNIVNPLGNCIDAGFGYERIDHLVNGTKWLTRTESLRNTILSILESDVEPSNKGAGYVLRRLIRILMRELAFKTSDELNDTSHILSAFPSFISELDKIDKLSELYYKHKDKNLDKDAKWWYETHGIHLEDYT